MEMSFACFYDFESHKIRRAEDVMNPNKYLIKDAYRVLTGIIHYVDADAEVLSQDLRPTCWLLRGHDRSVNCRTWVV